MWGRVLVARVEWVHNLPCDLRTGILFAGFSISVFPVLGFPKNSLSP